MYLFVFKVKYICHMHMFVFNVTKMLTNVCNCSQGQNTSNGFMYLFASNDKHIFGINICLYSKSKKRWANVSVRSRSQQILHLCICLYSMSKKCWAL